MECEEIKPREGVVGRQRLTWSPGSSLGFLTAQNQQDSFSACSTAGHAAVRDEVLTGHGPGNGSSAVERGRLTSAIKYQDAFSKGFQLAKKKFGTAFVFLSMVGSWHLPGRLIACTSLQPGFWWPHVLCLRALVT